MAKSLRSKTKRSFRRVKRESGIFAAADAARLHRLSAKLKAKIGSDEDGDVSLPQLVDDAVGGSGSEEGITTRDTDEVPAATPKGGVKVDASASTKISTSGRRLSRRDAWRLSKGKPMRMKNPDKLNRLGVVAAKRKAGRSHRRR